MLVFQGDSITDVGRQRAGAAESSAEALGRGYVLSVAGRLQMDQPGAAVHNRGVSGNRVTDLRDRWAEDCLALEPTVLSVLIGVNDTWHGTAKGTPELGTPLETFDRVYRELLEETRSRLPAVRLVIGEPFVLACGAVLEMAFQPEMGQRAELVRGIAADYADVFVPYQSVFDAAAERAAPEYWAADGVHPSVAGHRLMADAWWAAVTEA
ncbi:MAG: SGNH/GDSL hydrolase family protein [Planctomycetota bacterium]